MVKWEVVSLVYRAGMEFIDKRTMEFDESDNVFGRVLLYHEMMRKAHNSAPFKLVSAKPIKEV